MKSSQVNKLYSKLTPYEQAALSIEAAARLDESELDIIVASIERHTYQSLHADYRQRATGLFMLALFYGGQYWKNRALMLVTCNLAEDGDKEATNNTMRFFEKTLAIEVALVETCKLLKVDISAIKTLAGCPDDKAEELPAADPELVKQYAAQFAQLTMR